MSIAIPEEGLVFILSFKYIHPDYILENFTQEV